MQNVFTFPDGRKFALCYAQTPLGASHRQDTPLRSPQDLDQLMAYLGNAKLAGIWRDYYLDQPRSKQASPTAPASEIRKRIKEDLWKGRLYFIPRDDPEDKPENIDQAIRTARTSLQMHLRTIIQEEQKEKTKLAADYEKLSATEKAAFSAKKAATGLGKAAKDFLIWANDVADVVDVNRRAIRMVDAAKKTYWDQNKKSWGENLAQAEYKEIIEMLGFDPAKITRAQVEEAYELANLIWSDLETRNILKQFAIDYAKAQHHTEWTEMAGGLAFEVILTILIAAISGGAGGVAVVAKNAALLKKLERAGQALLEIGKKLKRLKTYAKRKLIEVKDSLKSSGGSSKSKHDKVDEVMHTAGDKPNGKQQPITKIPTQPTSLEDALERLKAAKERIAKSGYQSKYSDAELAQMAKSGKVPNERFYVRFGTAPMDKAKQIIEPNLNDGHIGYQRSSGRHPLWMSTFDQVENADSDPKLIAELFGTNYDPDKKYVMYIVDMGEDFEKNGTDLFVPTFENMKAKLTNEFEGEISSENINTMMSAEYAAEFKGHWGQFEKWAKDNNMDSWKQSSVEDFAESGNFADEREKSLFKDRSKVLQEIGAWDIFRGDGLTENKTGKGELGALEVLAIQHNPVPVREMVAGANPTAVMIKLW